MRKLDRRRYQGTATLRRSPEAVRRIPDLYSSAVLRAVELTTSAPDAQGWVRAEVPIERTAHVLGEVFKLGWGVEVLDPPELRAMVAEYAAELGARVVRNIPGGRARCTRL
jgi:predicted DNA-binding transcriptional regulator YafY